MQTLYENPRTAGFILSESNGTLSRDTITIVQGSGVLQAGTVLGKITATGKYAPSASALVVGHEGAETASAVLYNHVDATLNDVQVTAITRLAELVGSQLVFDASVTTTPQITAKLAQLALNNLITR